MSAILGDGTPLTANGVVNGSQLGTYTIPDLGVFRVESVVAQIDTIASGEVTPVLRVRDKAGAVIATKRQSSTIAGGGSGSATWALRLADDGSAAAGITQIVSGNGTVTVINPFGPVTDLRVASAPVAGSARAFGYMQTQVARLPGPTFQYFGFESIVGTRANGITVANYYRAAFTVVVAPGDALGVFYGNGSGGLRQIQFYFGIVQDLATGNIENITNLGPTVGVANGAGAFYPMAHNGGAAFLNYATPTQPTFLAAGTYAVSLGYNVSFLP